MTDMTQNRTGAELFEAHYDALAERLQAAEWQRELRAQAMERFSRLGFPTQRDEEWRLTPIEPLVKTSFVETAAEPSDEAVAAALARIDLSDGDEPRLVFINGRFSAEHTRVPELPAGVFLGSVATALAQGDGAILEPVLARIAPFDKSALAALNTALFTDGALVSISANVAMEQPIHVIFLHSSHGAPAAFHTRNLVLIGTNARALIVEQHAGIDDSSYFVNGLTEFALGDGSNVDHYKVQRESRAAYHFQTIHARQRGASKFDTYCMTTGGRLGRNDIDATIDGEGCDTILNGLFMLTGDQLLDTHTMLDHAKPHCHSREIYKGVLNGKSRAIFRGKILVRQHAQKTDAVQSSKGLLLSDTAQMNSLPQLEIYADDVKCTHGATLGRLASDADFYSRTRGLDRKQTNALLTFAFANDNLTEVADPAMRGKLEAIIHAWLDEHGMPENAE